MRQFRARIENPTVNIHAIELYMQAESILDAGQEIMDRFGVLGIDNINVRQLIDITPDVCDCGHKWVDHDGNGCTKCRCQFHDRT